MRREFDTAHANSANRVESECCCDAQTAEAKQRLKGPGLLVVDASPQKVSDDVYYVVENAAGKLEIVEGTQLNGATPCAQVLVCCRPPSMTFRSAATETASLLQL